MGPAARGALHVGLRADGARMPEALLVLFGLAYRWSGAEAAWGRPGRARDRGIAAARVQVHRAGRRQFLSSHVHGPRAGTTPRGSFTARPTAGAARGASGTDGAAGPI